MKAKMKDHLVMRYTQALPNELEACDLDDRLHRIRFLESIENKEVELVFTGNDAFEKNDNDIWLPNSLWEPL